VAQHLKQLSDCSLVLRVASVFSSFFIFPGFDDEEKSDPM
jgi:hypothetical protein